MATSGAQSVQREILPIPDLPRSGLVTYDAKDPDTSFAPIEPLRPPAGAPNVLVVLIDDAGFGSSSAFGGPCATPNAERLAAGGLKLQPLPYDGAVLADPRRAADRAQPPHGGDGRASPRSRRRRRATTRCGRTRARRWPRSSSSTATRRPSSASATRCRSGRRARWGHSTTGRPAAAASSTSTGSSAARPTSTHPALYEGTTPVEPDRTPEEGYHFTEDMTDKAIEWVRQQKALMPDKPFFVVLRARGDARAAPRAQGVGGQVQGAVRRRVGRAARARPSRARRQLGVVPQDAELTARPEEIPAWDDMPDELKPVLAPPDGGLRRLHGAHRPPRRASDRRAGGPRGARRHARLRASSATTAPPPRARRTAASTR